VGTRPLGCKANENVEILPLPTAPVTEQPPECERALLQAGALTAPAPNQLR